MKEIWRKVIIYDKANNEYVDLGEWYLVNQYGDIYSKMKNKLLKHNILRLSMAVCYLANFCMLLRIDSINSFTA